MHKLLLRQLARLDIDPGNAPDKEQWASLLQKISTVYEDADQERYLSERSLAIVSSEMKERWEKNNYLLEYTKWQNEILGKVACAEYSVDALKLIAESICTTLSLSGAFIFRITDGDSAEVQPLLCYGLDAALKSKFRSSVLTSSLSTVQEVAVSGSERFIHTQDSSDDIFPGIKSEVFREFGIQSCWGLPVKISGITCGVILFFSSAQKFPNQDEHMYLHGSTYLCSIVFEKQKTSELIEIEQLRVISSSKMAVLGEMAGGIAHEINNPLAIIDGLCYRLSQIENRALSNDDIVKSADKIKNMVGRIAAIVKALRMYSKGENGTAKEPISLQDAVDVTLNLCSQKLKSGQIELRLDLPAEPIVVFGSMVGLSQVLVNLVGNAEQAVTGSKSPWISISAEVRNDVALLRVTDSGHGIPMEIHEKIMQPFFTTKPFGSGTGIGLSIASGIINSHGGSLKYDEFQGNTSFLIKLPLIVRENLATLRAAV